MAGAGYKLFNTGDVLTAAQVNTYLMEQTVMVFADAAARTTALTGVVSEGMISYLKDTNAVEVYNGSAWVASDDPNAIQNTIVDAKGDLITATAADTPARLAVGSNGDTLVADSAATTGLRWQAVKTGNVLLNANFDIWQRGTSFTSLSTPTYTADRWTSAINATGENVTITQDTSVPNSLSKYSYKFVQTAIASSVTELLMRQFIEQTNVLKLLGKSCVLSFWYRSNKTGSHGVRIYGAYNTGGTDQVTTFTVNTADTWEYKTVAVTAFSGVTASSANPTDSGGVVDIGFRVSGAGFTSLSANDYFQVSQVQLEVGSVATAFQTATGTIQGELAACQRYYYLHASGDAKSVGVGAMGDSVNVYTAIQFPSTMRTAPTLSAASGTDYYVFYANANDNLNSFTIDRASTTSAWILSAQGGSTIGYAGVIRTANASASIAFSAEL